MEQADLWRRTLDGAVPSAKVDGLIKKFLRKQLTVAVAAALDAEDLKDLGLAVGLRSSVLRAIAESQHLQAGEVQ